MQSLKQRTHHIQTKIHVFLASERANNYLEYKVYYYLCILIHTTYCRKIRNRRVSEYCWHGVLTIGRSTPFFNDTNNLIYEINYYVNTIDGRINALSPTLS